jgi:hypothetical protein
MERSPDGTMNGYNLGMSQIGHSLASMGGVCVAASTANISARSHGHAGCTRQPGIHIVVRSKRQRWGGVWQDNGDGTFAALSDFYVQPTASHLDLLMGSSRRQVPDFFI